MDTTLSDPLVDHVLDGRYAVIARLARGGMASVYLATDTRLQRRVAVKVMNPALAGDPEFVARFEREARAAAALSHPDVVSVYDQGEDDGHAYLVMEYVDGLTLRELLRDRGRLSAGEALAVLDHVLAALGAAHRAGLVHRDVKPENVLLTSDGRVKVADFGLARATAGTSVTAADGVLLGTAAYLAPEQVRDGVADARSDVYSAGILLFELLTGTTPFTADTALSLAYHHVNDDVPPPSTRRPELPDEIDALVLAATARDPQQRPADAAALHASLVAVRDRLGLHAAVPRSSDAGADSRTQILDTRAAPQTLVAAGGPPPAQPPAQPPEDPQDPQDAPPRRRRRGLVVALLVVVAAVLAGVGGWWFAVGRYATVPSVLSLDRTHAVNKLAAAGLHAHWLPPRYSDTVGKGLVMAEQPKPGGHVARHGTVTLRLSAGPETHPVPDVSGDTVAKAKDALAAAHLTFAGTNTTYSDTVRKGRVISTDPPGGKVVRAGVGVTLLVSQGPRPVQVPDVTGRSLDDATSILRAAGLAVSHTDAFSDKVPTGQVISQTPASGATAHAGDDVALVVSKGPQKFPVPDVRGQKVEDAIKAITAAGFKADPHQIFPFGPGKVVRETPMGDQPKGTTIRLDYY